MLHQFVILLLIVSAGQAGAQVKLIETSAPRSKWVGFQAPTTVPTNILWVLPTTDGSANQCLATDGSGNLTWVSSGSGTGDFMANGSVPMSGALRHASGNASAPSVTFAADLDTGIYAPIADSLAVGTSGVERLRVLANGNVGVGISAPIHPLHIARADATVYTPTNSANNAILTVENSHPSAAMAGIRLRTATSIADAMINMIPGGSNNESNLAFVTEGAGVLERMRITSAGNVGIGTTNPFAKLDVVGEIKFGNTSSACNGTNEGQQRYNSATKNMEFCNGTAWTAYSTGGLGGRTACPAGFTLIGTSGTAEAFCISSSQETSNTWINAVTVCYNKSPKAKLCNAGEWIMACVAGASGPNNMTGQWEWVSELYNNANQAMGASTCSSSAPSGSIPATNGSRCCFR